MLKRVVRLIECEGELDFDVCPIYPQFMFCKSAQREFTFHGGRRPGAGRKCGTRVSHHPRPVFDRAMPAHVTLRVRDDVPSLRSSRRFLAIKRSFAASRGLHGLRLVEFSVLSNHLHLVVEAESSVALAKGMQGLNVRLAKALNAMLGRRGGVFADHYHSHLLRTPSEVLRALQYVRTNTERHYGERGIDARSSAAPGMDVLVVPAATWLLRTGWRRARVGRPGG